VTHHVTRSPMKPVRMLPGSVAHGNSIPESIKSRVSSSCFIQSVEQARYKSKSSSTPTHRLPEAT